MKNKEVTRLMCRINLIIKMDDPEVQDCYYFLIRTQKIWADINFISVRAVVLENLKIPVEKIDGNYVIDSIHQSTLKDYLNQLKKALSKRASKSLVAKELDKVYGIRDFTGEMLSETVDYIEKSKNVKAITYYSHRFFALTSLPEINRLIAAKTIELIPLRLLKNLGSNNLTLHEGYRPSNLLTHFIVKKLWEKDDKPPLPYFKGNEKKRIAVLFSDIKGFGQLIKSFTKDEASCTRKLVKEYQYHASIEIKSQGGYVVQTAGDAFMAVFSLDPKNEVESIAKVLESAIKILSIKTIVIDNIDLNIITRIGINIAEVEEGYLGALDLREYTVFGKDVNIASRLEKKVNDFSEQTENFLGGILLNLNTARITLSYLENEELNMLCSQLYEMADNKNLPEIRQILANMAQDLSQKYTIHRLFGSIKDKVRSVLEEVNQHKDHHFEIAKEVQNLYVKEGKTQCLFLYKSLDNQ